MRHTVRLVESQRLRSSVMSSSGLCFAFPVGTIDACLCGQFISVHSSLSVFHHVLSRGYAFDVEEKFDRAYLTYTVVALVSLQCLHMLESLTSVTTSRRHLACLLTLEALPSLYVERLRRLFQWMFSRCFNFGSVVRQEFSSLARFSLVDPGSFTKRSGTGRIP